MWQIKMVSIPLKKRLAFTSQHLIKIHTESTLLKIWSYQVNCNNGMTMTWEDYSKSM